MKNIGNAALVSGTMLVAQAAWEQTQKAFYNNAVSKHQAKKFINSANEILAKESQARVVAQKELGSLREKSFSMATKKQALENALVETQTKLNLVVAHLEKQGIYPRFEKSEDGKKVKTFFDRHEFYEKFVEPLNVVAKENDDLIEENKKLKAELEVMREFNKNLDAAMKAEVKASKAKKSKGMGA